MIHFYELLCYELLVLVIVLGGGQFGIKWPEGYYCQPEGLIQNCPTPNTIPG